MGKVNALEEIIRELEDELRKYQEQTDTLKAEKANMNNVLEEKIKSIKASLI
jgi:hypothetical protein